MTLYRCQHPLSHRSFRFTYRLCPTVFLSNIRVHACFHNCSHWVTHNLPLQAPAPSILPGSTIKMVRRPSLHDLLPRRQELLVTHPVGPREPRGLGSLTVPQTAHELKEKLEKLRSCGSVHKYYTQVLAHPPHTPTMNSIHYYLRLEPASDWAVSPHR